MLDATSKSLGYDPEEVRHALLGIAFWRVDAAVIPDVVQGILDCRDTSSDIAQGHVRQFWKDDVELFKMLVQDTGGVVKALVLISQILFLDERLPDLELVGRLKDALELVDVVIELAQLGASLPRLHDECCPQLVNHLDEVRLLRRFLLDQWIEDLLNQVVERDDRAAVNDVGDLHAAPDILHVDLSFIRQVLEEGDVHDIFRRDAQSKQDFQVLTISQNLQSLNLVLFEEPEQLFTLRNFRCQSLDTEHTGCDCSQVLSPRVQLWTLLSLGHSFGSVR